MLILIMLNRKMSSLNNKTCKLCTNTKNVTQFYSHKAVCKDCYKARQNRKYHEKKDQSEIEYVKYISRSTQTEDNRDEILENQRIIINLLREMRIDKVKN